MVKGALAKIVGRGTSAVMVKEGRRPDRRRHPLFDGDSCQELHGNGHLVIAGGLDLVGLAEAIRAWRRFPGLKPQRHWDRQSRGRK